MQYVNSALTRMSSQDMVTIKARGRKITPAVDVSQMIVKRMNTVGFVISDVRISSSTAVSNDNKERKFSAIEIDIKKA